MRIHDFFFFLMNLNIFSQALPTATPTMSEFSYWTRSTRTLRRWETSCRSSRRALRPQVRRRQEHTCRPSLLMGSSPRTRQDIAQKVETGCKCCLVCPLLAHQWHAARPHLLFVLLSNVCVNCLSFEERTLVAGVLPHCFSFSLPPEPQFLYMLPFLKLQTLLSFFLLSPTSPFYHSFILLLLQLSSSVTPSTTSSCWLPVTWCQAGCAVRAERCDFRRVWHIDSTHPAVTPSNDSSVFTSLLLIIGTANSAHRPARLIRRSLVAA